PDGWLQHASRRVLAAVTEHGPVTARALRGLVPDVDHPLVLAPGKRYSATVSAHTRVLPLLGFEGEVVRTRPNGSWVSGAYAWAATGDWLAGGLGDLAEPEAARELALRWLRRFGPGTTTDLQWWTGWTLTTTHAALAACGAVPVGLDAGPGWVAPGDEGSVEPPEPWLALLPGLDPTTMGWKQRDWYLPEHAAGCFDRMGNAGPTIWADGRVVGGWDQRPDGSVVHHLVERLDRVHQDLLAERTAALTAAVGGTRFTVRFPSPVSSALRAGTALG
ncbi:MAG: crosslink repair DNA glycosylase YcaQ family protein, partial [Nocardioidaceae bacterium]